MRDLQSIRKDTQVLLVQIFSSLVSPLGVKHAADDGSKTREVRLHHTGDEADDQDCEDRSQQSGVCLFCFWQAWVGAEVELFNLQERVFTVGVLEEGVEGDALLHPREGDSKHGVLFKGLEDLSE